ncbi:hypothetical protein H8K32_13115 [Undibacterium jejuense]|uniref:Uncharacterized protein n=1 Tax=Undibacterium jejuense TaxID=1344949 RepID=A0A923HIZ2_9BURK|nr:hypothetical protein [Undibacterium jejuense]MBC3863045.1 hypothetical protein [Undibacterium jejuense]
MSATIETPLEAIEEISALSAPPSGQYSVRVNKQRHSNSMRRIFRSAFVIR